MRKKSAPESPQMTDPNLPTRVSVLEHGVQELKSGLDGHRGETRTSFAALQTMMTQIAADVAKRANPTNWYGFIGAAAATVMIVGSVFALAEWRVSSANAPLYEAAREAKGDLRRANEQILELRIKQERSNAENERVRVEQEARIRSRVEQEARDAKTK